MFHTARTFCCPLRPPKSTWWLTVEGGKHAMLSRGAVFERAAADWATATLLGLEGKGPVARLLAGEQDLSV